MTLTIGRAAVDNPEKVSSSGERVTFEGDIAPANGTDALNVDEFLARRAQLVNMIANPDMDVWPVTWSEDDTFDGFWTVRRADVDPASVYLATGVGRYRVELERPTGLVSPLVECTTLALVMDNAAGVTNSTAAPVWAVPATADAVESPQKLFTTQPAAGTRTPAGESAVKLFRVDAYGASVGRWIVDPADFWDAASQVEVTYDAGTTYYPTVGRSFAVAADNWRLSNGFVRVTPSSTGIVDISFFNGSSWCTAQPVNIETKSPSAGPYSYLFLYDTIVSAVVLRNSPEVCSLRLTVKPSSLISGTDTYMVNSFASFDLTLRRGDVLVRCALSPAGAYGYSTVGVGTAAGAQTSLTSGVRADGTVNSGRILIGYVDASATGDTSQGTPGAYLYRYSTAKFCIGYEIAGASASTYNAAQQVIYQYLASLSERQRVVLR